MGSERTPGKPTTRRYSPAEKDQAVRMVRQLRREVGTSPGTIQRVAGGLGIGVESLRTWVKQADIDAGEEPGTTTDEAARLLTPYGGRHARATTWLRSGVALGTAARRTGHTVATLVSTYIGALEGADIEARKRIDAAEGAARVWMVDIR